MLPPQLFCSHSVQEVVEHGHTVDVEISVVLIVLVAQILLMSIKRMTILSINE